MAILDPKPSGKIAHEFVLLDKIRIKTDEPPWGYRKADAVLRRINGEETYMVMQKLPGEETS